MPDSKALLYWAHLPKVTLAIFGVDSEFANYPFQYCPWSPRLDICSLFASSRHALQALLDQIPPPLKSRVFRHWWKLAWYCSLVSAVTCYRHWAKIYHLSFLLLLYDPSTSVLKYWMLHLLLNEAFWISKIGREVHRCHELQFLLLTSNDEDNILLGN